MTEEAKRAEEPKARPNVIISGPDGVIRPEKPKSKPSRKGRKPPAATEPTGWWARLRTWWENLEINLLWTWISLGELAWFSLVAADLTQPFTAALHLLWLSPLLAIQAGAVYYFGAWRRFHAATPPTEVQPYGEDV